MAGHQGKSRLRAHTSEPAAYSSSRWFSGEGWNDGATRRSPARSDEWEHSQCESTDRGSDLERTTNRWTTYYRQQQQKYSKVQQAPQEEYGPVGAPGEPGAPAIGALHVKRLRQQRLRQLELPEQPVRPVRRVDVALQLDRRRRQLSLSLVLLEEAEAPDLAADAVAGAGGG